MHLTLGQLSTALLLANSALTSASALPQIEKRQTSYMNNAHAAISRLQQFYNNPYPGFWTTGWWNSANCLTLLAELRAHDKSDFIKGITDGPNGVFSTALAGQHRDSNGALAYDDFFDDELWWVVALIKTYDVTRKPKYLKAATESFAVVAANDHTDQPCGGIANAYPGEQYRVTSSTIATALYVEAAALLATRHPKKKAYYVQQALNQWQWLSSKMLIDGIIQGDSLTGNQCSNNRAFLTYIEGTTISGLVALAKATGDTSYLDTAESVATESINGDHGYPFAMVNQPYGIVQETCDPDLSCNADSAQFKGILMRGLQALQHARPGAVGGRLPGFLKKNADSIWNNSRGSDNLLGMRWAGPFNSPSDNNVALAQHSSATMALAMAAIVAK
ncbi:hypothetical protein MBLNU457_5009t1 [Dothideomycetes sp. NU457]